MPRPPGVGQPLRFPERALVPLSTPVLQRLREIAVRDQVSVAVVIRRGIDRELAREDRAAAKKEQDR